MLLLLLVWLKKKSINILPVVAIHDHCLSEAHKFKMILCLRFKSTLGVKECKNIRVGNYNILTYVDLNNPWEHFWYFIQVIYYFIYLFTIKWYKEHFTLS